MNKIIGGMAKPNGVMFLSDTRFSATAKDIDGEYEILQEKHPDKPKWLDLLSKIPILRGLLLPVNIWWQLKDDEKFKQFSKQDFLLSFAILSLICLPFVFLGHFYFVGLLKNIISLLPIIMIYILGIIGFSFQIENQKYHGAEHKVAKAFLKLKTIPSINEAKQFSRLHPSCGTGLVANWLMLLIMLSLLFPTLNFFLLCLSIEVISAELAVLSKYGLLGKVLNVSGLLLQLATTKEPDEKHLKTAILAGKYASELIEDTNLPRTLQFKTFEEALINSNP